MKFAVIVGAATKPGRLANAAARFTAAAQSSSELETIDLAATTIDVCDGRPLDQCSDATRSAVAKVAGADAVAIFAPTYRASYPGVLKNLLDQLPLTALRSKPVGIVAMGASDHHYLGVDSQLRPVLAWFGAVIAPVSVYLTGRDFDSNAELSDARVAELEQLAGALAHLAGSVGDAELGPPPLAARGPG